MLLTPVAGTPRTSSSAAIDELGESGKITGERSDTPSKSERQTLLYDDVVIAYEPMDAVSTDIDETAASATLERLR